MNSKKQLGFRSGFGKRDRFEWSADDDQAILAGYRAGNMNKEIAAGIGRGCTTSKIDNRLTALKNAGILPKGEPRPKRSPVGNIQPKPASQKLSARPRRRHAILKRSAVTGLQTHAGKPKVYIERPDPDAPPPALIDGVRVTVLTVSDRTCRWPHGNPGTEGFHFCGVQPKAGSPYCDHHHKRGRQPAQSATSEERQADT